MYKLAVLVGSVRHGSNSLKLAKALEKLGSGSNESFQWFVGDMVHVILLGDSA